MTERFYKLLKADGTAPFTGHIYSLPTDHLPGTWMPPVLGELSPCANGYHVCRLRHLTSWLSCGDRLFEVEVQWPDTPGSLFDAGNKAVARSIRLLRELDVSGGMLLWQWACDCIAYHLVKPDVAWKFGAALAALERAQGAIRNNKIPGIDEHIPVPMSDAGFTLPERYLVSALQELVIGLPTSAISLLPNAVDDAAAEWDRQQARLAELLEQKRADWRPLS